MVELAENLIRPGHEDSCVGTVVVYVLVSNSRVMYNTIFVARASWLS